MYVTVVCEKCGRSIMTSEGRTMCPRCIRRRENGQRLARVAREARKAREEAAYRDFMDSIGNYAEAGM